MPRPRFAFQIARRLLKMFSTMSACFAFLARPQQLCLRRLPCFYYARISAVNTADGASGGFGQHQSD